MATVVRSRAVAGFALLVAATGVLLAGASAAFAQESAGGREAVIEEIVVTAQKREESLQDVPFSVSAVTGQTFEKFHYQDLQDLNGTIPNVQFANITNVSLNLAPSIRGIGITNNPDPYTGTEVAVVIDGVIQGTRLLGLADQFDVERIEVLRGPQGTLFGANTLGGVVNLVTRQPTGEFGGYGTVTVGNYEQLDGQFALNFPIIDDTLAGKVSISKRDREGFYTNLFDDEDLGWVNSTKLRGYLLWTPTDDLSATLKIGNDRIDNGADSPANHSLETELFWRPGVDQEVDFALWSDSPQPNRADLNTFTLTADWKAPFGDLKVITNYLEFDAFNVQDVDALPELLINAGREMKSWQYSGEVQLVMEPAENLEVIAGAFFMALDHDVNTLTIIEGVVPGLLNEQRVFSREDSAAIFGQLYWSLTDRLRLGVGGRFTAIDVELTSLNVGRFNPDLHPFFYEQNVANAAELSRFSTSGSESWTDPSGKISLDYELLPGVKLYGYYARGFKAGGFNGRITVPEDIGPFEPEYIDSYEVGIRSDLLEDRLRLNVAAFFNDWSDMQVPQSVFRDGVASSTILNAAQATTKGVEVEFEAVASANFRLRGAIGYLKAEYDDFTDAGTDFSGRPTPYAPEWTGSLTAVYDLTIGGGDLSASLQYNYTGERWGAFTQYESEFMDSVGLVNANLSWSPVDADWSVALWATNLTNEYYINSALSVPPLFSFASYGAPRQYGIDFNFEF